MGRDDKDERVLVHVRVRPQTPVEEGQGVVVSSSGKHKLVIQRELRGANPRTFSFDRVYWSLDGGDHFDGQEDVYLHVGKLMLEHAFSGFNTCIFAYGQTGSGKTYTMMGDSRSHAAADRGIIPRACSDLFDLIDKNYTKVSDAPDTTDNESGPIFSYEVTCSYYEIYNERVYDLLEPKQENLRVREHPSLGPYVENLSVAPACVYDEVQALLVSGNRYRHTNSTKLNERSSRSHAIFTITLKQSMFQGGELSEYVSKINLVDLAGSERTKNAGTSGESLTEGININKSLCTLGSVIHNLAESHEKQRQTYINFRDSNLTWLLRENLGGNSKTIMVATVSPCSSSYDETLNTLRYADRVKQIRQKAIVNEDGTTRLIRDLRQEVAHLRRENMEVAKLKHELSAFQSGRSASPTARTLSPPPTLPQGSFCCSLSPYIIVLRPNPSGNEPVVREVKSAVYITDSSDPIPDTITAKKLSAQYPNAPPIKDEAADVLKLQGVPRGAALIVLNENETSSSVFSTNSLCTLVSLSAPCQVLDTEERERSGERSTLFHGCFFTLAGAIFRFVDPTAADHELDRLLWLQDKVESVRRERSGFNGSQPEETCKLYNHAQQRLIVSSLTDEQQRLFSALGPKEQQTFLAQQLTPAELAHLDEATQRDIVKERSDLLQELTSNASLLDVVTAASHLSASATLSFSEQKSLVDQFNPEELSVFNSLTPQGQHAYLAAQKVTTETPEGSATAMRDLLLLRAEESLRSGGRMDLEAVITSAPQPHLSLVEEAAIVEALASEDRAVFEALSPLDQQRFFATQPQPLEEEERDGADQDRIVLERRQVLHALRDASQSSNPPLSPLSLRAKQALIAALPEEQRLSFNELTPQEQQTYLNEMRVNPRLREEAGQNGLTQENFALGEGETENTRPTLQSAPQGSSNEVNNEVADIALTLSEQVTLIASLPEGQQEKFHRLPAQQQQSFLAAYANAVNTPVEKEGSTTTTTTTDTAKTSIDDRIASLHSHSAVLLEGLEVEAETHLLEKRQSFAEQIHIVRAALPEELQKQFDTLSPSSQKAFLRGHVSALQHAALSEEEKKQYTVKQQAALTMLSATSATPAKVLASKVVKTSRIVRDKEGKVLAKNGSLRRATEKEVVLEKKLQAMEAASAQQGAELARLRGNEVSLRERLKDEEGLITQIRAACEDEKLMAGLKVEEARKELVAKETIIKEVRGEVFAEREYYEKMLQEIDARSKAVLEEQSERLQQNDECIRVLEFQYQEAQTQHKTILQDKDSIIATAQAELHASERAMTAERHDSECLFIQNQVLEEKYGAVSASLKGAIEEHAGLVSAVSSLKTEVTAKADVIDSLTAKCSSSASKLQELVAQSESQTKAVEEKGKEIIRLKEMKQELAREAEERQRVSEKELLAKQLEMNRLKQLANERELAKAAVETQCVLLRERVEGSLDDVSRLQTEIQDMEAQIGKREKNLKEVMNEKDKLASTYAKEMDANNRMRTAVMNEHQQRIRELNEQLGNIQHQAREMQEKNRGLYQTQERIRERRQRLQSELERKEDELRETKMKYREAHVRLQSTLKKGKKEQKNITHLRRLTTVVKEQEARIDYLQKELRESQALSRRLEEGHAATYSQEQVQSVREDATTTLAALKSEVIQFTPPVLRQVQTIATSVQHSVEPRRIFRQVFTPSVQFPRKLIFETRAINTPKNTKQNTTKIQRFFGCEKNLPFFSAELSHTSI